MKLDEMSHISQTNQLGLAKMELGAKSKSWTVWLVPGDNKQERQDSTMPLQHSPFIFLSVWLVEFQPARSKPVCFVISGFRVLCLMSEHNLKYKPRNELFPVLQTCNVCKIPWRLVWGLINEGRCRVNIRLRSDHPPGHEANDQTYQMEGKQEKQEPVYIKQN